MSLVTDNDALLPEFSALYSNGNFAVRLRSSARWTAERYPENESGYVAAQS